MTQEIFEKIDALYEEFKTDYPQLIRVDVKETPKTLASYYEDK